MNKNFDILIGSIDNQRKERGFLTISETIELGNTGNVLLDPFSTLISKDVIVGSCNIFYPCVTIEVQSGGRLEIGNDNMFYPQSSFLAGPGILVIGNNNQFGEGGISIKSNGKNTEIVIGNKGRFVNGVQILGNTVLGDGSQIIGGQLTVQDCKLESGESYNCEDTDQRGAVMKGFGLARNIIVGKGKVLNGQGVFEQKNMQDQSFYHPKKGK